MYVIINDSMYSDNFCYAIWTPNMLGFISFIIYYYNFYLTPHVLWKRIVCYSGTLLPFTS